MPRHRLPEEDRRENVAFRLPNWLIEWLRVKGNGSVGSAAEKILREAYEKERGK